MQPFNVYLSWLIPAIMGQLQGADAVASRYPAELEYVASALRNSHNQPLRKLYRGLLLEPYEAQTGVIFTRSTIEKSVSFSEDRDVACYFADPETIMSGFVRQHRPQVEGYVAEYVPQRQEIMWHYSWNPFTYQGMKVDIRAAARRHPASAHDPAQFDFVFGTQKEVILQPLPAHIPLPVTPIADTCPDTYSLDRRFTPPHLP